MSLPTDNTDPYAKISPASEAGDLTCNPRNSSYPSLESTKMTTETLQPFNHYFEDTIRSCDNTAQRLLRTWVENCQSNFSKKDLIQARDNDSATITMNGETKDWQANDVVSYQNSAFIYSSSEAIRSNTFKRTILALQILDEAITTYDFTQDEHKQRDTNRRHKRIRHIRKGNPTIATLGYDEPTHATGPETQLDDDDTANYKPRGNSGIKGLLDI
ncbi:uncharacterized protein IL334_003061 [Kwoniella shivajii]|uniref:Uncharacterized protein n=1 Tax=Kwoniella shivajii TaxID=564305 RepID=A0ABZ1CWH4_9TREE|nr:hypothetical protein IL334_003061 [Kwoniella shivajii]